jgi:hypothetical protein
MVGFFLLALVVIIIPLHQIRYFAALFDLDVLSQMP